METHRLEAEYELSEFGILVGSQEACSEKDQVVLARALKPRRNHERQTSLKAALKRMRGARSHVSQWARQSGRV